MSGKLHEILAVEADRRGIAKKVLNEALTTFKGKDSHFASKTVVFNPIAEDEKTVVEGNIQMVDTVSSKLNYVTDKVGSYFDVFFQKEKSNVEAKADVILADGTEFLKDVPGVALLSLEKELTTLMDVYNAIPTLEPGVKWEKSTDEGDGFYQYKDTRQRTKKVLKPVVLYEATKEHPAQVEKVTVDERSGDVVTTITSSKLTPKEKSDVLLRLDNLRIAVKKARMRANSVKANNDKIGKKVFDYINKGTLQ